MRTDQHSVTAGLAHSFHHVLFQILANVVPLATIGHQQSFDVFQNRILIEIVANDFGDKGVNGLIVGNARPERVG